MKEQQIYKATAKNNTSNTEPTQQDGVTKETQVGQEKAHNLELPASQDEKPFKKLDAAIGANAEMVQGEDDFYPVVFSDQTSDHNAYSLVVEERKVLLAEPHVEAELLKFANTSVAKLTKKRDPKIVLKDALSIYGEYDKQVSFGENVQVGIATIYRIQEGMFLKRLMGLVEQVEGKRKWVKWTEDNIRHKTYRVIRQYIQLAETPKIIHYAPLGKELLVKLIAMLKSNKQIHGKDPIGRFLSNHGITYNLNSSHSLNIL